MLSKETLARRIAFDMQNATPLRKPRPPIRSLAFSTVVLLLAAAWLSGLILGGALSLVR